MKKTKKKTMAVCAALVGVLAIGGVSAYFTDTANKTNTFVIPGGDNVNGKAIEVVLTEPNYDDGQTVMPNKTIVKDPTVKLETGSVDGFIFATVKVPAERIAVYEDDGKTIKSAATNLNELFTYTVNTGWTELTDKKVEGTSDITHVYVWGNTTSPVKVAGGTTLEKTIFDNVTFANIKDKPTIAVANELNIDVKAYAIQADNLSITGVGNIWEAAKGGH